ncbi:MAG: four helix bundle protein [Patescibacteria group bacterium]|nr:four helix bundle protein [Patescibacteria group bacterium]
MNQYADYSFRKLEVWKMGMTLVNRIYDLTRKFPSDEKFSLTSQIRRAAISIPLNIAEGSNRRTKKDFASFVRIAIGSLMEVMTCLEIGLNQHYLDNQTYQTFEQSIGVLYFKLIALDKYLTKKTND